MVEAVQQPDPGCRSTDAADEPSPGLKWSNWLTLAIAALWGVIQFVIVLRLFALAADRFQTAILGLLALAYSRANLFFAASIPGRAAFQLYVADQFRRIRACLPVEQSGQRPVLYATRWSDASKQLDEDRRAAEHSATRQAYASADYDIWYALIMKIGAYGIGVVSFYELVRIVFI